MKKICIFVVLFSFVGMVFLNAQEKPKITVLNTFKNSEMKNIQKVEKEKSEKEAAVKDTAKTAKSDTTKAKAKKLSALRVGVDPQNFLRDIKPGEVLVKYIGKRWIPIKTGSGSGKFSNGLLTPGGGLVVSDDYKKSDKITKFTIWWCGNESETLKGKKGISLYIPTDSLRWVVSGNELLSIHPSNDFDGGKTSKLMELVERAFGDGGEIEIIGDNLIALNEKVDVMGKDISDIRASLGLGANERNGDGEKIESSSSWWKWALGAVGVVALGVITYKLLDHKDAAPVSIVINNGPTGGPVNPNN